MIGRLLVAAVVSACVVWSGTAPMDRETSERSSAGDVSALRARRRDAATPRAVAAASASGDTGTRESSTWHRARLHHRDRGRVVSAVRLAIDRRRPAPAQ